jgi:signal transduction histidine kinase
LGLATAIETECRAIFERGGPIVHADIEGDFHDVPKDAQLALYRVTQEALRNIQKHANTEEADVHVRRAGKAVDLTIRDSGQGFDRSREDWQPGVGLASMEERVRLLGGQFSIESQIGKGTTIHVVLA